MSRGQQSNLSRNHRLLRLGHDPAGVADFQPSPAAQQRALELLEFAKHDQLTPEQESELEHFTELEHIVRMAKARARQILASKQ